MRKAETMTSESLTDTTKTSNKNPTHGADIESTTTTCSCLPLSNKSMKKLRLVFAKFRCTSIKEEPEEGVHVRTGPRCVVSSSSSPPSKASSSVETAVLERKSTLSDQCSGRLEEDDNSETDSNHALKVSSHGDEEKESDIVDSVSPRGVMDVHAIEGSDELKSLAMKSLYSGSYSDSDADSFTPSCLTIETSSPARRRSSDDGDISEFTVETDDDLRALKEVSRPTMEAPLAPQKLDFTAPLASADTTKMPPFVENIPYTFNKQHASYTGPALHGRIPHGGMGRVEFESGTIYEGNVRKGKLHGDHGIIKSRADGSILYKGSFQNDQFHGHGEQYQNNVLVYSGSFVNGIREGFGRSYNPSNGKLQYEGQFENGAPAHAYFPFQGDEASVLSSGQLATDMSMASSVAPIASRYDPTRTAMYSVAGEDDSYMSNSAMSDMTGLSEDDNSNHSMMDYTKSYRSRIGPLTSSKVKESNDPSSLYSSAAVRFMI